MSRRESAFARAARCVLWAAACLVLAASAVNIWYGLRLDLDARDVVRASDVVNQQHRRPPRRGGATTTTSDNDHRDIHTFLSRLSTRGHNGNSGNNNTVPCGSEYLHPFQNRLRSQRSPSEMPHIIHINSKTRCVTDHVENYILNWRMPFYSVYLHDDDEMNRLFELDELFPSLDNATRCLPYQGGASSASKNDLFRFLLYYHVGGIYTEFDLWPSPRGGFPDAVELFEAHLVARHDAVAKDGGAKVLGGGAAMFFLKRNGMPFLGTMLATPGHPFFYICVDLVVRSLLGLPDVSNQRAFGVTGPPILHSAMQIFSGMDKTPDEGWDVGTYSLSDRARGAYPHLATHKGNFTIIIPEHESFYDYVFEAAAHLEMQQQKRRYYKLAGLKHWQQEDKGVHEYHGSCSDYLKKKMS